MKARTTHGDFEYEDGWLVDPRTGKVLNSSFAFRQRGEAVAFAKKNGLSARCVRSRPGGYVVERPLPKKES